MLQTVSLMDTEDAKWQSASLMLVESSIKITNCFFNGSRRCQKWQSTSLMLAESS